MKPLYRKILFLDMVLLCLALLLGLKEHAAGHPDCLLAALVFRDSGEESEEDPYGELIKKVALTFDDGPYPPGTERLLDGLSERKVKVTFFVLGIQAEKYPALLERMDREGHLIGNHTYSHIRLGRDNREVYKADLKKAGELIASVTGEEVLFVRPPFGKWDKELEQELDMFEVLWSLDPKDWSKDSASEIARTVLDKVKPGDIILLHDQFASSVNAAFLIIDELTRQGYEFVTVDELLLD